MARSGASASWNRAPRPASVPIASGSRFADVVEQGVAIIEDDVAGPLFKELRAPVFSPTRHLAYVARRTEEDGPVIDGAVSSSGTSRAPVRRSSARQRRVAVTLERAAAVFSKRSLYTWRWTVGFSPRNPATTYHSAVFNPDERASRVASARERSFIVIDGVVERTRSRCKRLSIDGLVVSFTRVDRATLDDRGRPATLPLADGVVQLVTPERPLGTYPASGRLSRSGSPLMDLTSSGPAT